MRIICGILGLLLGILITNALWVSPNNERAPFLTLAFIALAFLLVAVVKDFEW
jgi:hypothetical protein